MTLHRILVVSIPNIPECNYPGVILKFTVFGEVGEVRGIKQGASYMHLFCHWTPTPGFLHTLLFPFPTCPTLLSILKFAPLFFNQPHHTHLWRIFPIYQVVQPFSSLQSTHPGFPLIIQTNLQRKRQASSSEGSTAVNHSNSNIWVLPFIECTLRTGHCQYSTEITIWCQGVFLVSPDLSCVSFSNTCAKGCHRQHLIRSGAPRSWSVFKEIQERLGWVNNICCLDVSYFFFLPTNNL